METVKVADDLSVELDTPRCDLKYEGCEGDARRGYFVHGCAFYYACDFCALEMHERVKSNFSHFKKMRCKRCKRPFDLKNYIRVIDL